MLGFALWFTQSAVRRRVVAAAAVPAAVLLALYLKKSVVFGVFGAGTSGAANLTAATVGRTPAEERDAWIREGKLSPYASVDAYRGPSEYVPFFPATEDDRWPPMMN